MHLKRFRLDLQAFKLDFDELRLKKSYLPAVLPGAKACEATHDLVQLEFELEFDQ
jgi:hypothetical protein